MICLKVNTYKLPQTHISIEGYDVDYNYEKHEFQEKKRYAEIERVFNEALDVARKKSQLRPEPQTT